MLTVYVLTLKDGAFYVGQTQDLVDRLRKHNRPFTGAKDVTGTQVYVWAHGGVKSVTVVAEDIETREEAMRIEEQTVKNLQNMGCMASCHLWRDPITGQKSDNAQRLEIMDPQ